IMASVDKSQRAVMLIDIDQRDPDRNGAIGWRIDKGPVPVRVGVAVRSGRLYQKAAEVRLAIDEAPPKLRKYHGGESFDDEGFQSRVLIFQADVHPVIAVLHVFADRLGEDLPQSPRFILI